MRDRRAGIICQRERLRRRCAVNRLEAEIGRYGSDGRSQRYSVSRDARAAQFEKPARALIRDEKISVRVEGDFAGRGESTRGGSRFSRWSIEPPNLVQAAAGAGKRHKDISRAIYCQACRNDSAAARALLVRDKQLRRRNGSGRNRPGRRVDFDDRSGVGRSREDFAAVERDTYAGGRDHVRKNFQSARRSGSGRVQHQYRIRAAISDIKISRAIERESEGLDEFEILPRTESSHYAANDSGLAAGSARDAADRAIQGVGYKNRAVERNCNSAAHRERVEF